MVRFEIEKKNGLAGPRPKFYILFRTGSGSGRNFYFYFGPGRERCHAGQVEPEKNGPCGPLGDRNSFAIDGMHIISKDKIYNKVKLTYAKFWC